MSLVKGDGLILLPAGGVTPTPPTWNGLPTNNKMAELGHSFIANGQYTTDGYRAYGVATAAADDSGQVVRRLGAAGAFGVGGDTTTMIDARFDAALAACAGGTLYVWNGINDDALTVDQTLTTMLSWKAKAFAAKTAIIFHTITPCGNDAFPTNRKSASVITDMKARNTRIKAELPGVGCKVVDCFAQVLKAGTDFDLLEKWSPQDGKHPGTVMVQEITGPADAIVLKQLYPTGAVDLPTATRARSINTNVELTGASTTAGSTLPTGYTSTKATGTTGTTLTYQEVTTATGRWCEVVMGGTAATANAAVDILRQISLQAKLVSGMTYEGVIEYEYDAGMQNILAIQLGMQEAGSSTLLNWDNNRYATQVVTPLARKGWMRTPPFTAIDGLTDHRLRLSAYLSTAGAPAGKMRFRFMENRDIVA